ncbi:MAG: ROK family protein [Caldilineaceae bacterium]
MWTIGVDIGGSHTKLGVVNQLGEISHFRRIASDVTVAAQPCLARLLDLIETLRAKCPEQIAGIGLSLHGYVDTARRGPIICPNTPALNGLDLHQLLEDRCRLPVIINNDLTAHVLAEYHFGNGRGARRFLCLAIGTGLGAGVIVDGKALRYVGGCAGDTGHIILQPGGPTCAMGCRGCAEALCGVAGIERLARTQLGRQVTADEVIAGAAAGLPEMTAIMEQIGSWLGLTCASLCAIFLPDRVALTGGVAEAGEVLLDGCRRKFQEVVGDYHRTAAALAGDYYSGVDFVLGEMRGQTGVVGAVVEFFQQEASDEQQNNRADWRG